MSGPHADRTGQLYIGGRWVTAGSAGRIEVISPLTEQVIGSVPAPTEREADAAVAAVETMGRTLTAEMGAPLRWTTGSQAGGSVAIIRAMAEVAQSTTMSKLVPALLAGCSVVVKPSPQTPLDALLLAGLIDGIGLPDGAVSILTAGGGKAGGLTRGWFVEPTIFADVSNGMRIAREEIFGPVLSVIPYDGGDEEAIAIANDSDYGLAGSVRTADLARGEAIARQVRTGMIGVNGFRPDFSMPFGGIKASGIGREFGREGLETYTEPKALYRPVPA